MKAQLALNCPTTKPRRSCGKFALNTIPSSGETRSLATYSEQHFPAWQQRSSSGSDYPLDNWLTGLCSLILILARWQFNHRRKATHASRGPDLKLDLKDFVYLIRWRSKLLLTLLHNSDTLKIHHNLCLSSCCGFCHFNELHFGKMKIKQMLFSLSGFQQ